jgi:hypothetical protein
MYTDLEDKIKGYDLENDDKKARPCRDDDSIKETIGERYYRIWDFMLFHFKLEKTELLVYSLVFNMYKVKNTYYSASREYTAKWTGASLRSVSDALKSLIKKELIFESRKYVGQTIRKVYTVNTDKLPTWEIFDLENRDRDRWAKANEKKRANGEKVERRVPAFYPENDGEEFTYSY